MTTKTEQAKIPEPDLPPPPGLARYAAMITSLILGVSVLPGLWLTLVRADSTLWFSTLFELLVLAGAAFGVFSGLGRFRSGWALSLACVAGTVLVCGVFAFVEIRANFGSDATIGRLLQPYLAFRLGLAALLALIASFAVFSRNPACWKALAIGAALLIPAVGVLAWLALTGGGPLGATRATPGAEAARLLMLCFGGLVLIGLVSVGGHMVIRAYELGRPAPQPSKP